MRTRRVERVSVTSAGEETTGGPATIHHASAYPQISSDGRFVVFASAAKNLHEGDTESWEEGGVAVAGDLDVFVHDRSTGATNLVSANVRGEDADCGFGQGFSRLPAISGDGRYISFFSCGLDMTSDDSRGIPNPPNASGTGSDSWQILVRDQGPILGPGGLDGSLLGSDPGGRMCIKDGCTPMLGPVSFVDERDDVDRVVTQRGGNLIGGHLVYRPVLGDIYLVLELESMPPSPALAVATAGIVYGMSFDLDGRTYEIRAASTGLGPRGETAAVFGLFSCSNRTIFCTKVADLHGGFGTTGQRITFSVPLDALGIDDGSAISDVKAFTSLGSYLGGPGKVFDTAKP